MTDVGCLCTKPSFVAAGNACITSSCPNADDQNQARTFAQQVCAAFGINVSTVLPGGATSTGGSAPSATPTHNSASSTFANAGALGLAAVAVLALAM